MADEETERLRKKVDEMTMEIQSLKDTTTNLKNQVHELKTELSQFKGTSSTKSLSSSIKDEKNKPCMKNGETLSVPYAITSKKLTEECKTNYPFSLSFLTSSIKSITKSLKSNDPPPTQQEKSLPVRHENLPNRYFVKSALNERYVCSKFLIHKELWLTNDNALIASNEGRLVVLEHKLGFNDMEDCWMQEKGNSRFNFVEIEVNPLSKPKLTSGVDVHFGKSQRFQVIKLEEKSDGTLLAIIQLKPNSWSKAHKVCRVVAVEDGSMNLLTVVDVPEDDVLKKNMVHAAEGGSAWTHQQLQQLFYLESDLSKAYCSKT